VLVRARRVTVRDLLTHGRHFVRHGRGHCRAVSGCRARAGGGIRMVHGRQGRTGVRDDVAPGTCRSSRSRRRFRVRLQHRHSPDASSKSVGPALDVFLRTRITAPLGMTSTSFFVPPAQKTKLTAVYRSDSSGRIGARGRRARAGALPRGPRRNFAGGAGLVRPRVITRDSCR
jgi:hypothetical protein